MKILFAQTDSPQQLVQLCRQEQPDQIWLCFQEAAYAQEQQDQSVTEAIAAVCSEADIRMTVQAEDGAEASGAMLNGIRMQHPDADLLIFLKEQDAQTLLTDYPELELRKAEVKETAEPAVSLETSAEEPAVSDESTVPEDTETAQEPAADTPEEPAVPAPEQLCERAKSMIAKLIDEYDYRAARSIAALAGDLLPESFDTLLHAAALRAGGRYLEAQQLFRSCAQGPLMPTVQANAEYYLRLEIFLKQKRFTDMLRAIPAYLVEVLIAAIRKKLGTDVTQYFNPGSKRWDENKLVISQMTGKFSESFKYHTKPKTVKVGGDVTTAHLSNFIENMSVPTKDSQFVMDTLRLRQDTEEKLRILANQTLIGVTAYDIQKNALTTPEDILAKIRTYVNQYTDIQLTDEYLASYDRVNAALKSYLA